MFAKAVQLPEREKSRQTIPLKAMTVLCCSGTQGIAPELGSAGSLEAITKPLRGFQKQQLPKTKHACIPHAFVYAAVMSDEIHL